MMRLAVLSFLLASIPAAAASADGNVLIAQLCNGGTIAIPLGNDDKPAPIKPCHIKACHAGTCRQKAVKSG
uniref:hypothetical protein n=1 Tax=uncultured Altererythrobacter sp. TaxID=500840 RepID=UPI00262D8C0B|nr:hypothetical protein [uncultured Altererythrobacter sp.]